MRLRLLLAFFVVLNALHAQDIWFERVPNELGLSQNFISALFQDRDGYIWVGTKDGLNRFDGYKFDVFLNDPFDSTSISANFINAIFEDSRGWLWVGTADGLNLMDRKTETFRCLYPTGAQTDKTAAITENHPGLSHRHITSILEDQQGNIWLGMQDGSVNKLEFAPQDRNLDAVTFTVFRPTEDPNSLWQNRDKGLSLDESGGIWVCTADQACVIRRNKKGSYQIQRLSWETFGLSGAAGATSADQRFHTVFNDRQGAVWVKTATGFSKWLPAAQRFDHTYTSPDYLPALALAGTGGPGLIDRYGRIWEADQGALVVFDTASGKVLVRHDARQATIPGLPQTGFRSLMEDRSGNIWVGINGHGLFKYSPQVNKFSGKKQAILWENQSVRSIYQTRDGVVWIGTAKPNLIQVNLETGAAQPVVFQDMPWVTAYKDEFTEVLAMQEDRFGDLWLATRYGLVRIRHNRGTVLDWQYFPIYHKTGREATYNAVLDLHIDPAGTIWLLTNFEFGRFDPNTGQLQGYNYLGYIEAEPMDYSYPCIHQQKNGTFWLGTSLGLLKFDPKKNAFTHFTSDPKNPNSLSQRQVKSILPDPKTPEQALWIGTAGGGLNRFDLETQTFTHFKKQDGLPDNVVYGILDDEQGNLWLSTNQGLSKFNPQTKVFKNYKAENGLQDNEFNSAAYFKGADGRLFFGGIYGFNAFFPEAIQDDPFVAPIVFSGLKLANKTVNFKIAGAPLKQAISETRELILSWEANIFSLEFAALDFTAPGRNQYAYKLEGFNDSWQYVGNQRTATFTNIPPGTYTFRVKGTNHDGLWNETGASLRIRILPPWWRTWWAYLAYALLLGAAAFGFYKFQLNRQLERAQAERVLEMDALKTRLYTNISHEFRTPLTVIMGMVDNIRGHDLERDLIARNSQNLLRLINQMLDLAKLDSGAMQLHLVQSDIVNYLRYLLESFHSLAAEKGISLEFESELSELLLDYDAEKLQHVLYNLLSNALKFTPAGGRVVLNVAANVGRVPNVGRVSNPADVITLTVTDTGPGIAPDQLPHIFDRFYQVDSTATRKGEGSGIGLALTKELVELMGGAISVQSTVGAGAVFSVRLPVKREAGTTPDPSPPGRGAVENTVEDTTSLGTSIVPGENIETSSKRNAEDTTSPLPGGEGSGVGPGPKLLIIEDNRDIIAYLKSILERDYNIDAASDGQAGIDKAFEQVPDIIITDVMMPEKDGYEVCQTLKTDPRTSHIPIIMLTAKATESDRVAGLKTGADAYLMKPFNREELLVRLEKLVELRRTLQERFAHAVDADYQFRPAASGAAKEPSLDEQFLQTIRQTIDANLDDPELGIAQLCQAALLSHTQLFRKLKALTGEHPTGFIRKVRLHKAKQLLQTTEATVAEIAYDVGFTDPNHFSRAFSQEFGAPPSALRK